MAGARRTGKGKRGKPDTPAAEAKAAPAELDTKPAGPAGLPLPSSSAGTNLVIADIVLRAAGGLLRDRLEKGLIVKSHGQAKADKLVDGRGAMTTLALWSASHLARRSPLGLAVVAGGLAAKVFYDRGRRLEKKRQAERPLPAPPSGES
ncbi:MAG: hypothetical protein NBV68_02870 [Erythrobacter sp.]|uniref:hypothetical protein n=1 Tax=Erythrobacter sp. TaxID=1042 RepID=UPI0025FAEF81|nr:hypothetical protein [Erythrobacter sp.]MCL9998300.1 hypothetical protein [Erythrobacter sp.]